MDQRNQYPYAPASQLGGNPPAYCPYPQQEPLFPPASEFGQSHPQTSNPGYPPTPIVKQSYPYVQAEYPVQSSHAQGDISDIPPIGFYTPPARSQQMEDDEPKLTPFHDDIRGYAFSEKSIRLAFIRKVFGILSVQLAITTGFIGLFVYHKPLAVWTQQNSWFLFACIGVYIVTVICLICCESVRRHAPQNYIFLTIFTLATSVMVGAVSSTYEETSVLLAGGVTVVVCVSLTIFAFQTKIDFTRCGGILFVMLIVLILFGIITILLRDSFPMSRRIYSALGAMLFSAYLVHDVQLLIGGDHKYSVSPEEYVFAALTIYLDVINIFLYLLRLFGQKN